MGRLDLDINPVDGKIVHHRGELIPVVEEIPLDPETQAAFEYDFMNYLPLSSDQIEFEVPTIMPEVLEDYVAGHSPLSAPSTDRITAQ